MDIKTIVVVGLGVVLLVFLTILILYRRNRYYADPFEDMQGHEFEQHCAVVLGEWGFTNIEVTQGSRDYGVDIFARKDGITYAIQCKCYSDKVGIKAIQEVYAGRDYYDCMVGAVMTNQYFTKPAIDFANKLNVLLWDGDSLKA